MMNAANNKWLPIAVIALVILVAGYFILAKPDQRNAAQKIGDAIGELPNGIDKAARQLEDRTPGDKLDDAAQDAKESIKDSLNRQ